MALAEERAFLQPEACTIPLDSTPECVEVCTPAAPDALATLEKQVLRREARAVLSRPIMPRHILRLVALLAASALLAACQPEAEPARPGRSYEACASDAAASRCEGDAVCAELDTIGVHEHCTFECVEDDDCPVPVVGRVACTRFVTGAYCAVLCVDDGDCLGHQACVAQARLNGSEVRLCV